MKGFFSNFDFLHNVDILLQLCVDARCIPVDSLAVERCPNCHGHGVCNALGQCHCDPGYAPPHCDESGNGGSLHSGPSSSGSCKF